MSAPPKSPLSFLEGLRLDKGLTRSQLSEASGVSADTIMGIELGHSGAPSDKTLIALASGLGMSASALRAEMPRTPQTRKGGK